MFFTIFFSICCFSNFITLGSIDDEKIVELEKFVRDDLLELLHDKCDENGLPFDGCDKKIIFGLYHAKPEKFRFLPGEKVLLKKIADHMSRMVVDEDENNQSLQFKAPAKYKMSRKDTCRIFGATFFGKTSINPIHCAHQLSIGEKEKLAMHKPVDKSSLNSMIPDFISKAKMKIEEQAPNLTGQNYLTEDMIKIIDERGRITARMQCVFCLNDKKLKKEITIQYDPSTTTPNLFYWNFSNFKKHFKRIHPNASDLEEAISEKESIATENDQDLCDDDFEVEIAETDNNHEEMVCDDIGTDAKYGYEELEIVVLDETDLNSSDEVIAENLHENDDGERNTSNSSSSCNEIETDNNSLDINSSEFAIYDQISQQNLVMTNAFYLHKEKKVEMSFQLNGKSKQVNVIKIKADGNCLFGSLAHQLFQNKVNSIDHVNATKKLRASVVEYIIKNINDFSLAVKGRIFEEEEVRFGRVVKKANEIA